MEEGLLDTCTMVAQIMAESLTKTKSRRVLEEKGVGVRGVGGYAIVIEHPYHPNRVLRITNRRNDGCIYYHKWLVENGSPTGTPKIESMYVLLKGGRFYLAVTEMPEYSPWNKRVNTNVGGILVKGFYKCLREGLRRGEVGKNLGCALKHEVVDRKEAISTLNAYLTLLEACREEIFPKLGYDLGGSNIMLDGLTAVVTDPFSGVPSKYVKGVWENMPVLTESGNFSIIKVK